MTAAEGLAELRDWIFCQGRSDEEIERIIAFVQATFPPPASAALDAELKSSAAKMRRRSK
jgi:hypothetical protein